MAVLVDLYQGAGRPTLGMSVEFEAAARPVLGRSVCRLPASPHIRLAIAAKVRSPPPFEGDNQVDKFGPLLPFSFSGMLWPGVTDSAVRASRSSFSLAMSLMWMVPSFAGACDQAAV